jgi:ABC-type multidrug transport system ATPase subunit
MILGMRGLAPFDGAVTAWRSWNAARSSFERLNKILLEKRQTVPAPLPRGRGMAVTVDRLVFAPPNSRNVLFKGFSFKAGPGQIIAIAGFNGVGKTALLKLIMGIWLPGSGSVKLDDVEASRVDRTEMGAQIGYLAQNPFLFPGTIAENIARLGNAEMRDIVQAAELAGAHQFILDLPDGYDTRVDRGGRNLSGGQRQLIALAAALFSRPRLLLLDEPTTALDDIGVDRISELIEVLRRNGITTFIVSHEREILARADAILALADGQIQVVPVKGGAKPAMPKPVAQDDEITGAEIARGLPPSARPDRDRPATADIAPSDGQMRITPKQIAVPNPDAPRPIVEKNSAPNTHPAAATSAPEPEAAPESVEMPEIADFGNTGETGSGRAQVAKQAAGIAKTEMKPQPTPGGTMMTMRPVSKKPEANKDASRKDPPKRPTREARPASAADLVAKRPSAKPKAQPERQAQPSRKPAAQRKISEAEAVARAREEAAMRMRKVREDAERAAAARAPRRRPSDAVEGQADREQVRAQTARRGRPQLRVVEGSAERRQGGA